MRRYKNNPPATNFIDITAEELNIIVLNAVREEHKDVPFSPTARAVFSEDHAGHTKAYVRWDEKVPKDHNENVVESKGFNK